MLNNTVLTCEVLIAFRALTAKMFEAADKYEPAEIIALERLTSS